MSDLISREEAIKALGDIHPLDYNARAYKVKINAIPSADILEHARAIKEYCKNNKKCDTCSFRSENFMGCSIGRPMYWGLPKGEKGGAE